VDATERWVDPVLVERYVSELARHGAHGETGVWRLVYTPEWVAAQDTVAAWCEDAGIAVERDTVGNVWGHLTGRGNDKLIVTGSHIDSQRPGGRFDGALGVIAAVIALQTLSERFGPPTRSLTAVSLAEEESSRFPAAKFWGSRAIVGRIGPDDSSQVVDFDGCTIADAMRDVGLDPARIAEARRNDIDAFLELHIEQGPVLEQQGLPVGIVERIAGYRQYVIELKGEANHAGTTPMDLRQDAMGGAIEIASGVLNTAYRMGRPAVTTVGRMVVEPNIRSIVPARVEFSIDARHSDPDALATLLERHEGLIAEVATRRDLPVHVRVDSDRVPHVCDPALVAGLREAALEADIPALPMVSGAVHDAQQMAAIARVAMIFVQSRGGLSHTPAEYTATEHAAAGIEVLTRALYRLAY
jgi:allantoate deiminase